MSRFKIIYFFMGLFLAAIGCSGDDEEEDNFDHEGQIAIDQDLLDTYFETHYYNTTDGGIWTIGNQETGSLPLEDQLPLKDNPNLKKIEDIEISGVDTSYTMYYLTKEEGSDPKEKGKPSLLDSVYVKYTGVLLDSTVFESVRVPFWYDIRNINWITGWRYGVQNFKGGRLITDSENEFHYEDFSKGIIIFPSGLGYRNVSRGGIPKNSPLIFYIEVHDVNLSDDDLDSVPTRDEVSIDSKNGDITLYDTDEDNFNDYLDRDDDGDGRLTIDEVETDLNGNVIFEDSDNDGIPDYKDPDS